MPPPNSSTTTTTLIPFHLHSLLLKTNHPFSPSSTLHWTSLISSLSRRNLFSLSLLIFRSMLRSPSIPDSVTLLAVLSASSRISHLPFGESAHLLFLKLPIPFTLKARNAAIHFYAKCGRMDDARKVFDEIERPNVVSWTAVLNGTVKFEGVESARKVFERMPERNEVSWTVMVVGFVEARKPREAFKLLGRMVFGNGLELNGVSVCSLLSACSQTGDLAVGRWVHAHLTKLDFVDGELGLIVDTALVDMYGKCGRIRTACMVFETMRVRNVVTWNVMLSGLSMHGMGYEVLRLFDRMIGEEFQRPDDITFVAVLSACSRSGLVTDGKRIFDDLRPVYGLNPTIEHYACVVDLLGRAGKLDEAETLVKGMPFKPNEVVLGSLLASCGLHGKLELGKRVMHELIEMNPNSTDCHAILSNLYLSHGRQTEAGELWREINKSERRKGPGMSYIEVNGNVHRFSSADRSHPRRDEVYAKLDEMVKRLRVAGYNPNVASKLSRVKDGYFGNAEESEEEEQSLLSHGERLAIAFGLITMRPGVTLHIFMNLRICSDCHLVVKLISEIYEREIIVRDRNRFHCFKQGNCSCSDYW